MAELFELVPEPGLEVVEGQHRERVLRMYRNIAFPALVDDPPERFPTTRSDRPYDASPLIAMTRCGRTGPAGSRSPRPGAASPSGSARNGSANRRSFRYHRRERGSSGARTRWKDAQRSASPPR